MKTKQVSDAKHVGEEKQVSEENGREEREKKEWRQYLLEKTVEVKEESPAILAPS